MPITAQGAARPKLNLPPLRPIDGGKTVDAGELDRFTRAVHEWGQQVDRMLQGDETLITALTARVVELESMAAPGPWSKVERSADGGATTSASYVNWPTTDPLVMSFTKRFNSDRTELLCDLRASFYTSAANVAQAFGVSIVGTGSTVFPATDFTIIDSAINAATFHDSRSGGLKVTGLAAGTYTITMRAKSDGATTLSGDSNDNNTLIVTEIPVDPGP